MKKLLALLLICPILLNAGEKPEGDGWKSLFNGKNLKGWKNPEVDGIWTVVDGVIDCVPKSKVKGDKNLWTRESFGDFELHVEWRLKEKKGVYNVPVVLPDGSYKLDKSGKKVVNPQPGADSGILMRGEGKSQVNIWCWPIGSGEVYGYRNNQKNAKIRKGVTPKVRADNPVGEWNTFRISLVGEILNVELNGKKVIENAQLPGVPEEGPIALQHHGGYNPDTKTWSGASSLVQFRNIWIREK